MNIAAGRFPGGSPPTPYVAGVEAVDTVLRSARFAPGTRVYSSGRGRAGSATGRSPRRFAVPDAVLVEVPDRVDDVVAAAFGVVGIAGWLAAAWRAPVRPGESVLDPGCDGGVGTVSIQAVKVLGAGRVVGVGATRLASSGARSLRRGRTVTLEGDGFAERLAAAVAQAPPTLILDGLSGVGIEAALSIAPVGARASSTSASSAGPLATLVSGNVRGKQVDILGYQNFHVLPDAFAEGYRTLSATWRPAASASRSRRFRSTTWRTPGRASRPGRTPSSCSCRSRGSCARPSSLRVARRLPPGSAYLRRIVEELGSIGSSPLGFRTTGTPEDRAAAEYVAAEMREIGLADVAIEEVRVDGWRFHRARRSRSTAGAAIEAASMGGVPPTPVGGIVAPLVDVGTGERRRLDRLDVDGPRSRSSTGAARASRPSDVALELGLRGAVGMVLNCPKAGPFYQSPRRARIVRLPLARAARRR